MLPSLSSYLSNTKLEKDMFEIYKYMSSGKSMHTHLHVTIAKEEISDKVENEKMQSLKQKMRDAAAAAKEHVDALKAKAAEKRELSMARTKEGKEIAKERRKAKEAEAKMRLHAAKAEHAAEKLQGKRYGIFGRRRYGTTGAAPLKQGHHYPGGTTAPMANPATNNPLGGHRRHHHHHMGMK